MEIKRPRSTVVYLALMGRDTTVSRNYYISELTEQLKSKNYGQKDHRKRKTRSKKSRERN